MIEEKSYKQKDYDRVLKFLREMYKLNKDSTCMLAQQFEDLLIYVNCQNKKQGKADIVKYIHLWEDNGAIVGICHNDGNKRCFTQIRNGYEFLFADMLNWAEREIVKCNEDVAELEVTTLFSRGYKIDELLLCGYTMQDKYEYNNYLYLDQKKEVVLPQGFEIVFGEDNDDRQQKSTACFYGLNPDSDKAEKPVDHDCYYERESATMYKDSIEVLTCYGEELCSYMFCYVDKTNFTAYISPLTVRQKFRKQGLSKAMLNALINRLIDEGIKVLFAFTNCSDRNAFYTANGFFMRDKLTYWYKSFEKPIVAQKKDFDEELDYIDRQLEKIKNMTFVPKETREEAEGVSVEVGDSNIDLASDHIVENNNNAKPPENTEDLTQLEVPDQLVDDEKQVKSDKKDTKKDNSYSISGQNIIQDGVIKRKK